MYKFFLFVILLLISCKKEGPHEKISFDFGDYWRIKLVVGGTFPMGFGIGNLRRRSIRESSFLSRVIYALVGISGIYAIRFLFDDRTEARIPIKRQKLRANRLEFFGTKNLILS